MKPRSHITPSADALDSFYDELRGLAAEGQAEELATKSIDALQALTAQMRRFELMLWRLQHTHAGSERMAPEQLKLMLEGLRELGELTTEEL